MISCEQYDVIEIACMYRLLVKLELQDGTVVQGKAMDTKRSTAGEEGLEIEARGELHVVVLNSIKKMIAQVDNPHFDEVVFSDESKSGDLF